MCCEQLKTLKKILGVLKDVRALLRMKQPGLVWSKYEEIGMQGYLTLNLPEATKDTVKRVLTYSINGGEPVSLELGGDVIAAEKFPVAHDDVVTGTLQDSDKAGNASPVRDFSITVVDNIAPAQPGEVSAAYSEE
jgi:hypothetical protein